MLIRCGYEMSSAAGSHIRGVPAPSFTMIVQPASGSRTGGFEPPHRDD
jgi:hypothetical protein